MRNNKALCSKKVIVFQQCLDISVLTYTLQQISSIDLFTANVTRGCSLNYWKKFCELCSFALAIHNKTWGQSVAFRILWVGSVMPIYAQIARFMGPTWGPPGSCQPQMAPMLAPWTLLSGWAPSCFILLKHTLMPNQNGLHFADNIFTGILVNENLHSSFSPKFIPNSPIIGKSPLVQIMVWPWTGIEPFSVTMS